MVTALLAVTFLAGLLPGCVPLWLGRSLGETAMRWMTGIAAGFLLTAALLVAVPEGFEFLASGLVVLGSLAIMVALGKWWER